MRVTREKNCYCHTCGRDFHYLGITNHRKSHRNRGEDCTITYTHGDTITHRAPTRDEQTIPARPSL